MSGGAVAFCEYSHRRRVGVFAGAWRPGRFSRPIECPKSSPTSISCSPPSVVILKSTDCNRTPPLVSGYTSSSASELRARSESVPLWLLLYLVVNSDSMAGLRRVHEPGHRRRSRSWTNHQDKRQGDPQTTRYSNTVKRVQQRDTDFFTGQILLKGDNVSLIQGVPS